MSKPRGYWQKIENAKKEAHRVMKKEGWEGLPGSNVLNAQGYSNLSNAIFSYYGGMEKFRVLIGSKPLTLKLRLPHSTWKSLEYTITEARRVMVGEGWDNLPGADDLGDKGYHGLKSAIIRYHGGFHKFREELGEKQKQKKQLPARTWKSLEFTLNEAKQIMEKEGWKRLPNKNILDNKGYYGVSNAIAKYHDGFPKFRQILQERLTGRTEAQQLSSLLEDYTSGGQNE